jgi:hypothetical protein
MIKLTDKAAEFKKDSARALWYGAIAKANGKTAEDFVDAATKAPPVLKKDGKAEHPAGWLRYFMKEGMVQLVNGEAAPAPAAPTEAPAPATKTKKKATKK